MKKTLILGLPMAFFLIGCAPTLTKIEDKYGRPARVELECIDSSIPCNEDTYYNNKDAIKYIVWFYYWQSRRSRGQATAGSNVMTWDTEDYTGWACREFIADKNGKVIKEKKYIEQPNRPKQGRTPIQTKDKLLPGMEKTK